MLGYGVGLPIPAPLRKDVESSRPQPNLQNQEAGYRVLEDSTALRAGR